LRSAKAALRRSLASIRMPPATLASASAAVCSVTAALPEWRAARCVACYLAMPHEPATWRIAGAAERRENQPSQ
jgi:5-formyltetrahydrofolate cyclo-ligase